MRCLCRSSADSTAPSTLNANGAAITACGIKSGTTALPGPLTVAPTTCVISGTPNATLSATQFTLIATNSAGNSSDATVNLTVNAAAPTVVSVSSTLTNGTYGANQIIPITVQFSTTVNVTGTPEIILGSGVSTPHISYISGSGSNTLAFQYTIASNDAMSPLEYQNQNALILNGGTIVDGNNTAAVLGLPAPGASGSLSANRTIVISTPASNSWTTMTTTNAPTARYSHTAVWTGSVMIVWGGFGSGGFGSSSGAKYNPFSNTWQAISSTGAPVSRGFHTAIWSGSEMIVWGGCTNGTCSSYLNDGAKYNPTTDSWSPISSTGAPAARYAHTAVWTGSEMIVWGGFGNGSTYNDGFRYNPSTNAWTTISTTNAPSARDSQTAVWTGSKMLIWGGTNSAGTCLQTGGEYTPTTNRWAALAATGAPSARAMHTAIFTGTDMIVWGGQTCTGVTFADGGRYNPSNFTWSNAGSSMGGRYEHTSVWDGSQMVVFGGRGASPSYPYLSAGATYVPGGTWVAISTGPAGRMNHSAVWNGTEMIVWGGANVVGGLLRDGSRYRP